MMPLYAGTLHADARTHRVDVPLTRIDRHFCAITRLADAPRMITVPS